jgi:TonB family protein
MNFFYTYLVQSTVSIIVLYLVYWLFLKRDTFFSVNRFFLAGSIVFSLIFPAIRWNIISATPDSAYAVLLQTVTITPEEVGEVVTSHLTLWNILAIIYLTGASLFFVRFIFQVLQVLRLVRKYGLSREMGMQMVFIDRHYQPFSFFGIIFIPGYLKDSGILPQIVEHEKVHIRQYHSFDLVLLEILTIIHWFNPVIWLYRRSVKSIHEYLADEGVIIKGFDTLNYQEILLGQTLGIQVNDLTNNFNHSLLKNRIIMMTKKRSGQFSGWKAVIALPVLLGLVITFSASVQSGMADNDITAARIVKSSGQPMPIDPTTIPVTWDDTLTKSNEPVYDVVKTMPEFKGGFDAMVNYLVTNIKYPEDAKKNNIQGTVFVSFIVMKNGKVEDVSILKGVNPDLDNEALRVVKGMPDWNPGRNDDGKIVNVRFNLPIKFALDSKDKKE